MTSTTVPAVEAVEAAETAPGAPACVPCAADPLASFFASRSVAVHLLRGALGLVLAVAGLALAGAHPAALLLLVPAVVAWRGCPTCWALGLAETRRRR